MVISDDHIFIGFDCAYRTLGWCILGYNPRKFIDCTISPRDLIRVIASGVEDVLGEKIDDVDHSTRAQRLVGTIRRIIPFDIINRANIIIERQPRKRSGGFGSGVHDSNLTIEGQLIYHFSVVCPAKRVYLVNAGKKNKISCMILKEEKVKTYAQRKKQVRSAFVKLAKVFNFDSCPCAQMIRKVKADQADACLQIIAAIFLCAKNI